MSPGLPENPGDRAARYGEVLGVPEFRAMFLAQGLSVIGDQVAKVALALLIYRDSQSALLTALAYAVSYLPWLTGGPLLAALADRLPRRSVMVWSDLARAALVILLAVPGLPLPVLYAVLLAVAMLAPPFESARAAVLPDVLPGDRYVIGSSLTQLMYQVGQVAGFAAGGALVALLTTRGALLLDALTFAVSALVLQLRVQERPAALTSHPAERRPLLSDAREGVAVVYRDPLLRRLVLLAWLGAAFTVVPEGVAVVLAIQASGGAVAAGLLTAALPLGAAVGAVAVGRFCPPSRRLRLMLPLAVASVVPLVATSFAPNLVVVGLLWWAAGIGTAFQLPANATFVAATPPEMRGRAFGLAVSGLNVGQGLALAVAGLLAEAWPADRVVSATGVVGVLTLVLVWWRWPRHTVQSTAAAPSLTGPEAVR